jgi:hypothetical protein
MMVPWGLKPVAENKIQSEQCWLIISSCVVATANLNYTPYMIDRILFVAKWISELLLRMHSLSSRAFPQHEFTRGKGGGLAPTDCSAGSAWRMSLHSGNKHWNSSDVMSVTLRLAVCHQSVRLGPSLLTLVTWVVFFLEGGGATGPVTLLIKHPLWREEGFVSYEYAWFG